LSLVALGVGGLMLYQSNALTVAQRLEAAAKTTSGEERASLLAPLKTAEKVTSADLKKAGELLLQSGENQPAIELAEAYQARFPKDAAAYLLEGRAATKLLVGKRATAALEKAAELAPRSAEPDLAMAELRELQGDLSGMLDALNKAAKKLPDDMSLATRRGHLLSQAARLDEASDVLSKVLAKQFDAPAAAELGFVRFRQNAMDEALSLLTRALKKDPGLAKAHYYLGAVLYRQGDLKKAERAYREADRLDPTDFRPLTSLCEVQSQAKSPGLEETKKAISTRFSDRAGALLAQCAQ
jgi:tetratricopeptide (TPR) repeat protein